MATKKSGFGNRVTLETSAISFLEKSVTPNSLDGGDPIDLTNNSKTTYREQCARVLVQVGGVTATVEYDPSTYASIVGAINTLQVIRVDFYDGDQVTFYGWLRSFTPSDMAEGAQPTAEIVIESAGVDADGDEEGIVYSTTTTT